MTGFDFTAHNVELRDGTHTRPQDAYEIADNDLARFSVSLLRWVMGSDLASKRIIDLGCLEGGYTVAFARTGIQSVGLEVRKSNFVNCQHVKDNTDLATLSFINDDIRNLPKYGIYDAIFCCGLLYHLDKPNAALQMFGAHCRSLIIIDTHVADPERLPRDLTLSEMTEHEGVPGRWYDEFGEEDDPQVESAKWGSWRNNRSFWPTKPGLIRVIKNAGFEFVFEQHFFDPERQANQRVTLVGIKANPTSLYR